LSKSALLSFSPVFGADLKQSSTFAEPVVAAQDEIYCPEGEKDVETVVRAGVTLLSFPGVMNWDSF
jgi:hypothetical protein